MTQLKIKKMKKLKKKPKLSIEKFMISKLSNQNAIVGGGDFTIITKVKEELEAKDEN